jgi:hypothetical protein
LPSGSNKKFKFDPQYSFEMISPLNGSNAGFDISDISKYTDHGNMLWTNSFQIKDPDVDTPGAGWDIICVLNAMINPLFVPYEQLTD